MPRRLYSCLVPYSTDCKIHTFIISNNYFLHSYFGVFKHMYISMICLSWLRHFQHSHMTKTEKRIFKATFISHKKFNQPVFVVNIFSNTQKTFFKSAIVIAVKCDLDHIQILCLNFSLLAAIFVSLYDQCRPFTACISL